MENLVNITPEYNTLDALQNFLKTKTDFECNKEYDIWEQRTNGQGQMEQCLVLKKSNMHAIKIFFINESTIKINHIIPNKMMNAYFGKSVKARRSILEVVGGVVKQAVLKGGQEKAFEELEAIVVKASK